MLSWVSPVLGWALKCLAQAHSPEKTQRIQCGSNPGSLDYESNTLPLSHLGPFFIENIYNRYIVLLAQWYTNLLPPDGVHPLISSFLILLFLYLIRPDLFVVHYSLFIFSKNSFLSLASLTNATQAYSTLWFLFFETVTLQCGEKCHLQDILNWQHVGIACNQSYLYILLKNWRKHFTFY